MANIVQLKDSANAVFYPQTHEKAVIDSNGINLQSKLQNITAPSYVVAWDGTSTPVVANIPAGVTFTFGGNTYTGTLAASSSTTNKTYLVGDNNGHFDQYVTQVSGNTYSWVYLGNTSLDLSGYATDAELNQLDQKLHYSNAEVGSFAVGYYSTYSDTLPTSRSSSTTTYSAKMNTSPGAKYKIYGEALSNNYYRIYAFYDSNEARIDRATVSGDYRTTPLEVTAPSNAAFMVVNLGQYNAQTDKIINEGAEISIPELANSVKDVKGKVYTPISSYEERNYAITGNGKFGSSTSYKHICVPVVVGEQYAIKATSVGPTRVAYATSASYSASGDIPLVVGTSVFAVLAGVMQEITIPAGCKYLLIYNYSNSRPWDIRELSSDLIKKLLDGSTDLEYDGEVIIGALVNKSNDGVGLPGSDSTTRAGMETTLALPYTGVTFHFTMPDKYVAGIRHGTSAGNLITNSYWFRDGDIFTFPNTSIYYRIVFAIQPNPSVSEYSEIVAADVEAMIAAGAIRVRYKRVDLDGQKRNGVSDNYTKAVILKYPMLGISDSDKFPTFVHTTDIHGDAYRLQDAIDCARHNFVDALLVTGDVNAYNLNNGFKALESMMVDSPIPVLYCRGNHESYGNSDVALNIFSKYYSTLASKWSYLKEAGTAADKTYYFKDFDAKKIRVIALNPYEKYITSNNSAGFTQDQINWFITVLKSTPQDYGILCVLHSPEAYPNDEVSIKAIEGKTDFFLDGTPTFWGTPVGINGTPLRDIIDAFISRTTISKTITQTVGSSTDEIIISGDFSTGVNTGVEFIAWVCGHEHLDLIGLYRSTTNNQVVLNMTCGICYYGSSSYPYLCNASDTPRGPFGVPQDAINVYAIDRTNKQIRIARVGANMTEKLTLREAMVISYAP